MIERNRIYNADCMEWLDLLDEGCCDMLFSDWPYGTTHCHWDIPLPLSEIWPKLKRVVKPNGAIVLFSAQPFTTDLIMSNRKMFRYEIIWEKTQVSNQLNAKKQPLRTHENICVFYQRAPVYNPQMRTVARKDIGRTRKNGTGTQQYNEYRKPDWTYTETGERYPTDVIHFSNWNGALFGKTENATKHPTQKPVELCEWFIKTYTNEGETVLDNCAGSGSIPLAALNTSRNFYACEKDAVICKMANERLNIEAA